MGKLLITVLLLAITGISMAENPQVTIELKTVGVDPNTLVDFGSIVIELYKDDSPITTENFVRYVQDGFYDGLIFHRVINNFVIQAGGYDRDFNRREAREPITNESFNGLQNTRGTIAMARTPEPDSATSEFFINLVDNPNLNFFTPAYDSNNQAYSKYGYCVFGEVISGMDIVDTIATLETDENNRPVTDIIISHAYVSQISPVCAEKLIGDVNGDCIIDLFDISLLATNWLECNSITNTCGD